MTIIIDDNTRLSDIQLDFREQFKYLKLEFFELAEGRDENTSRKNLITNNNKKVGEIREVHFNKPISFHGNQQLSTLESNFKIKHGLNVQVFRKVGNTWLETTTSDSKTLAMLNREAIEHTMIARPEPVTDFESYHEQL